MDIEKTPIEGLLIIKPNIYQDSRGYFSETYQSDRYKKAGILEDFTQDNLSKSSFGVLRGLHFQKEPYAQSKLVSVLSGKVLDIAVDIRRGSPTYGKHYAIELSDENHLQFYIPKGFAHGFVVLSKEVLFSYKVDNYYNKESEAGVLYNDAELKIDWQLNSKDLIISDKDIILPSFKDVDSNFSL